MPTISSTSETYESFVQRLNARKQNNIDISEGERIKVCNDFQRGDEETGVWGLKMQQCFIDSLINGFPISSTMLIKPYIAKHNTPWCILDGGNRARCVRDFFNDEFKTKEGKLFSELSPKIKANLENMQIYIQYIRLQRDDPLDVTANIFTRINTKIVPLSQGELIKAHGWQNDIPIIELAKKIVGCLWVCEDDDDDDDNDDNDDDDDDDDDNNNDEGRTRMAYTTWTAKMTSFLRKKWHNTFLGGGNKSDNYETKRCDNLALACGFIVSSLGNSINLFTKEFNTLETKLTRSNDPSKKKLDKTFRRIDLMLNIVKNIKNIKKIFKPQCGFPSKMNVFPIWGAIIKDKMTADFKKKTIVFYNSLQDNDALHEKYKFHLTSSGDSHTTASKLTQIIKLIDETDITNE
jgi:hypothetical protein